jgi:hypothetical protein
MEVSLQTGAGVFEVLAHISRKSSRGVEAIRGERRRRYVGFDKVQRQSVVIHTIHTHMQATK